MIDPRELRIGNLVKRLDYNEIRQVAEISHTISTVDYRIPISEFGLWDDEEINPVPLTEEWLERLGFINTMGKFKKDHFIEKNGIQHRKRVSIKKYSEVFELSYQYASYTEVPLNFVHQLQNLYFALTGSELELKEKP